MRVNLRVNPKTMKVKDCFDLMGIMGLLRSSQVGISEPLEL